VGRTGDPDAIAVGTDLPTLRLRSRTIDRWLLPELERYVAAGGAPGDEPYAFAAWLHRQPCPPEVGELPLDGVDDYIDLVVENHPRFVRVRVLEPDGYEDQIFYLRGRASAAFLREAARQEAPTWDGTLPAAEEFEHTDDEQGD
jgi:hypothetical protein